MEPPINSHADAIRDEKLKVLRSLKPWTPESLSLHAVRGQYTAGTAYGERVQGYRDEPGVDPDSRTETFVALRTEIANWRWAGVPFYIRTGKRLASRDARIVVNFRADAACDLPRAGGQRQQAGDQPAAQGRAGAAHAGAGTGQPPAHQRQPSAAAQLAPVQLDLDFDKRFGAERVGAYERLLLDVIDGPPEPVRAQRRAGRGMALGGAADRQLGIRRRPAPLCGRHLGPERIERDDRARRLLVGRRAVTFSRTARSAC
jgi:glucose-6-phosphate 1-dehydrogenase